MIWFSIVNYLREQKVLSKWLRCLIVKYISVLVCTKPEINQDDKQLVNKPTKNGLASIKFMFMI